MTRTPRRASSVATDGSSASKNCPSSMPTTSVSFRTLASSSAAVFALSDGILSSLCDTM